MFQIKVVEYYILYKKVMGAYVYLFQSGTRGLQRLSSLNYYNVLCKYVRTMISLLFDSPAVLPR